MRKLAEVLKVPMAFFYSDTDEEVAELLLRYGQARGGAQEGGRGVEGLGRSGCVEGGLRS